MNDPRPPDLAEGDVNLVAAAARVGGREHRARATRALLDRDATAFLHQSLSTPCFDALRRGRRHLAHRRRRPPRHGLPRQQRAPGRLPASARRAPRSRTQLDTLPFSPRRFTNGCAVELAERLAALAPDPLGKVLFAPGGTLAIGMALKLARVATGRHKTISLWDSFHGASLDAISIGGEAVFRKDIGPLLPGTEHAPPCDPRDCRFGCGGSCNARCAEYVDVRARQGAGRRAR